MNWLGIEQPTTWHIKDEWYIRFLAVTGVKPCLNMDFALLQQFIYTLYLSFLIQTKTKTQDY